MELVFNHHFRGDLDGFLDGTCDRAIISVHFVNSIDGFAVGFVGDQVVGDVNPFHDEHIALFFNLTGRFRPEFSIRCVYLTRFQRASKGSGQSPGSRGYQVVNRGRVGLFFA